MTIKWVLSVLICVISLLSPGITHQRRVVGWGNNLYGELAETNRTMMQDAVDVDFLGVLSGATIKDLVVGWNHAAVLTSANQVFTWGLGQFGALGSASELDNPRPNFPLGGIKLIASGRHFIIAVDLDDTLWGWGYNDNGQIGTPMGTHRLSPTPIDKTAIGTRTIKQLSVHPYTMHIVLLTTSGEVFAWGYNNLGQVGDGTTTDRSEPTAIAVGAAEIVSQVSAGSFATMALTESNKIYAWGRNSGGVLGTGNASDPLTSPALVNTTGALAGKIIKQIYAGSTLSFAFDADGVLYGWGGFFPEMPGGFSSMEPVPIPSLASSSVSGIFSTFSHNYIIMNSSDIMYWGGDTFDSGRSTMALLPVPNYTPDPQCPPIKLGIMLNSAFALTNCSTVVVWGEDLPAFGAKPDIRRPQPVPVPPDFYNGTDTGKLEIVARKYASAVLNESSIYFWGAVGYLQKIFPARLSTNISTLLLPGQEIEHIWWGTDHFLMINKTKQILTSGSDKWGQLGNSLNQDEPIPYRLIINDTLVVAGAVVTNDSNFVWMETGELFSWGFDNELRILGLGFTWVISTPQQVSFAGAYPDGFSAIAVATGSTFTVALGSNGQLASWGSKWHGSTTPVVDYPQALVLPGVVHFVTMISAGHSHAVVHTQAGRLFVWGDNSYGQLGDGSRTSQVTPVELTRTGSVLQDITIVAIECGPHRTYVLDSQGYLYGWGSNYFGEISSSLSDPIVAAPVNMTADLFVDMKVLSISAGETHSLAVVSDFTAPPEPPAADMPPVNAPEMPPAIIASPVMPPVASPASTPLAPVDSPVDAPAATPVDTPVQPAALTGISSGAIAGIIVGLVCAAGAVAFLILFVRRRKRRGGGEDKIPEESSATAAPMNETGHTKQEDTTSSYSSAKLAESAESDSNNLPSSDEAAAATAAAPEGAPPGKSLPDFKPEWMIDYKDIRFQKQIGSGSFGTVFLGTYGEECAIKQASFSVKKEALDDFKREAALILSIKPHPAIVQVLGIAQDHENIYVIMELCDKGSLDKLLQKTKLSNESKIRILTSAAAGIAHLHKSQVIHRDIAARNILVASPLRAKVADFGMSRIVGKFENKGVTASNMGPIRWMSPESIAKREYSPASDVWMFAVLCVEVWTEQPPHSTMDNIEAAMKISTEGLHPTLPGDMPQWLQDICLECWSMDPAARPTMSEIVNRFKAHAASK